MKVEYGENIQDSNVVCDIVKFIDGIKDIYVIWKINIKMYYIIQNCIDFIMEEYVSIFGFILIFM